MPFIAYCFLELIAFSRGIPEGKLRADNWRGYMDYYHRIPVTQSDLDDAVGYLLEHEMIRLVNGCYVITRKIAGIKRKTKYRLGDLLGLRNSSRTRFRDEIKREYGIR